MDQKTIERRLCKIIQRRKGHKANWQSTIISKLEVQIHTGEKFDHKTKLKINQHKEQDKDIKYQEQ